MTDDKASKVSSTRREETSTEQPQREELLKAREYLDLAEVMFVALNSEGVVVFANRKCSEVFGHDNDAIVGKDWFKTFLPKRLRKETHDVFRNLMKGKIELVEYHENPILTKDGEERIIAWHNTVTKSSAGRINGILSSGEDITERKRTQRELRKRTYELNERLKEMQALYGLSDLLRNSNQPLDVVLTNAIEIIVRGFQYPEITCGRVTLEGIEHRSANFMETPWLLSEEIWVDGKKAGTLEIYCMELRPEADEGPFFAEERALMATVSREISHFIEYQRSQSRLRETMQRLQAVTDSTLDAIIMGDQEGRFIFWNPAAEKLFGYSHQEMMGQFIHETIAPMEYLEASAKGFEKFRTTGRGPAIGKVTELSGKRKDGTEFPIELSLAPIPIGDLWGAVGTIRDITERKQNEEQRRQQHSELEVYAALIRHDLRNDVGVILGNVDLAKMIAGENDSEILETLSSTEAVCERMMNLLKAVSRPADSIERNIVALVRSVSSQAQDAHARLTVNVTVDDDAKELTIAGNRLLPMVFENLLRNAAAHSGEKPVVDMIISQEGSNVQVLVSDNGPGVPEEIQGQLFHRGVSTSGGGLGLYLSRAIVNAMNGSIELMDTDPGEGATFRILLPLTMQPGTQRSGS